VADGASAGDGGGVAVVGEDVGEEGGLEVCGGGEVEPDVEGGAGAEGFDSVLQLAGVGVAASWR
jgi:hypothetical protein